MARWIEVLLKKGVSGNGRHNVDRLKDMNKSLLMPLVLLTSSICFGSSNGMATEPPCASPPDTVKQSPPQNAAAVKHHFWEVGQDSGSNEHLKTLHLFFRNGDYAVIQHRYCSMYNFEIAYFRSGLVDDIDAAGVVKIVSDLYEGYAAKKVTFKRPLAEIVSASLKDRGFDGEKKVSTGLPEGNAKYPNARVQYSVSYTSIDRESSIYSSMVTFTMGIGGAT